MNPVAEKQAESKEKATIDVEDNAGERPDEGRRAERRLRLMDWVAIVYYIGTIISSIGRLNRAKKKFESWGAMATWDKIDWIWAIFNIPLGFFGLYFFAFLYRRN